MVWLFFGGLVASHRAGLRAGIRPPCCRARSMTGRVNSQSSIVLGLEGLCAAHASVRVRSATPRAGRILVFWVVGCSGVVCPGASSTPPPPSGTTSVPAQQHPPPPRGQGVKPSGRQLGKPETAWAYLTDTRYVHYGVRLYVYLVRTVRPAKKQCKPPRPVPRRSSPFRTSSSMRE